MEHFLSYMKSALVVIFCVLALVSKIYSLENVTERHISAWVRGGEYLYLYNNIKLSWLDAEMYCSKLCAHLTSIHSLQEKRCVEYFISEYEGQWTWLGGFKLPNSTQYLWTDGTAWDFVGGWGLGQPNNVMENNCIQNGRSWFNYRCEDLVPSICKKRIDDASDCNDT
uniref:C-type lectin domain-containing protein n=1 Tax=Steinernema glaseri TaxID=37863 RepID=A0A1I7ZN47_9BILA